MPARVVGIVYVHENNALLAATKSYCRAIENAGYQTEVVDLSHAEGSAQLSEQLAKGDIQFCFGLQGVGSRLESDGINLWTRLKIPFLCVHFDNPCYQPFNHFSISSYVANLYQCQSFLDIQQRYIGGNQIVGLLPFELPESHHRPATPFEERPYKFLYLKSGGDTEEYENYFSSLPALVRTGVYDIIEQTQQNPNLLICGLVDELFVKLGYDRHKQEKDFWTVVQSIDFYIRRKHALDFVEWLKQQKGAVIIGDGWDAVDKTDSRAEFLPSMPVEEAFNLYEKAQFVCNTNPYGADLIHERIVWGLMMESCVITDTNAWWDQNFAKTPALIRFNWKKPLSEQLQPFVNDLQKAKAAAATGRAEAMNQFLQHHSTVRMLAFAEEVRRANLLGNI